ncbi:MAG: ABC transporter ATP-binding protein [Bacillota bacterium]
MLSVQGVSAYYGQTRALYGVDLQVGPGEIVCLVGPNGAGKSTTLKAIMGLVRVAQGEVLFEGKRINGLAPHHMLRLGIALVPEGRRIFPALTVKENLLMGAWARRDREGIKKDMDFVFSFFPRLHERQTQLGGTLSGGEQQMLAIGRALMSRPRLLMMDEPTMGLAPVVREEIMNRIRDVNRAGVTVLLVEQNASLALAVAERAYVMETGRVVLHGPVPELLRDDSIIKAYLGRR